jgi:CHAT domain-containing protein
MLVGGAILSALLVLYAGAGVQSASGTLSGDTLAAATPVERTIAGTEVQTYRLPVEAGTYATFIIEQHGIDVLVRVEDPQGKLLAEFDRESRIEGREAACLVADAAGEVRITVQPRYPKAAGGRYVIRLDSLRAATDRDRDEFESHKLFTSALASQSEGKYDEANKAAARALMLAEHALGANDPFVGAILILDAELTRSSGDLPGAERLFQRAIIVNEAALGPDDPQTANARVRLGALYTAMADYVKAERLLEEGLAATERALGPDHPRVARQLMAVVQPHSELNDLQFVRVNLERALAIVEKNAVNPDDYTVTAVVHDLAILYDDLGDYDRAESYDLRALAGIEKQFGPENPRVTNVLLTLGVVAREKQQYAHALELLWRAHAIREKTLGVAHADTAAILISIANVYHEQGQYERALDTLRRAREVFDRFGPYYNYTAMAIRNAARTYAAAGDAPHALEYERETNVLQEKSMALNLMLGAERQKLAYTDSVRDTVDRAIFLHTRLAPASAEAADDALLTLLRHKGRVLDAVSGNLAALRERLTPADRAILEQYETVTSQLATRALKGPGRTPFEEYTRQLVTLDQQREQLERDISSRSAEFRAQALPVTIAAVRTTMPLEAALIEFSVYRPFNPKLIGADAFDGAPRYIAYVLRREGPVAWKELGPAAPIDAAIGRLRQALRDPSRTDVRQLARVVDARVLAPLRPLLGDATQLLISPDGELNRTPFEALVDARQHYAIEQYAITYLSSGRDLLRLQIPRASMSGPLVIAHPAYGDASSGTEMYFAPLPGSMEEGRVIKTLFPEASVLTGGNATKAALLDADAPSILHIATHAFVRDREDRESAVRTRGAGSPAPPPPPPIAPAENPLLRSGLALSGANVIAGHEAGILTALEASTLNLWGTRLVTLSACDTGSGDVKNGEGVYGLRRAFLLAGAETLVMSLWPVSDYVTREMMTDYYRGLKAGLGRGAALRQVQRAMLLRKGRQHPFYWAAFIQAGAWTPLNVTTPAVPVDPTTAILEAFRQHPIVAVGDAHGDQQGEAFQLSLIRDPRFAAIVNDIVIETGNSRGQEVVDRFVRGEEVPREALRRVWLDTTQQQVASLEVPAVVTAVRALNATLPADRRLRVLIGEPPIDWANLHTTEELHAWENSPASDRDLFGSDLIRREVLATNRRALVLYGAGHFFRRPVHQSIVTLLESTHARVFTIWTNVGAELSKMQADVDSWPVPSLARVRSTRLGTIGMATYLGPNAGDVSPEWLVPIEEQFDAVLYLGPLASLTFSRPPPWPCNEPALPERLRRLDLVRPGSSDRVKQQCVH